MKGNSYKVPDGYFDELNRSLRTAAAQMEADAQQVSARPVFRVQLRSAAFFAASFVGLVVLAVTGYYFTGHSAHQQELTHSYEQVAIYYDIDPIDMVDYMIPVSEESIELYASASRDYMDVFGYPSDIYE
ncbi:MAG: hypothetical protein RRY42_00160 [Mucinivorans sp.]